MSLSMTPLMTPKQYEDFSDGVLVTPFNKAVFYYGWVRVKVTRVAKMKIEVKSSFSSKSTKYVKRLMEFSKYKNNK